MHRIATVQTRGRITLPVGIREALQIAPGDNVVFVETAAGRFEVKAEPRTAFLLDRRPPVRIEARRGRRAYAAAAAVAGNEPASADTGR